MFKIITLFFIIASGISGFLCNSVSEKPLPPTNLRCELLEFPQKTEITDPQPEFGWVVRSSLKNDFQTAYQLIVASDENRLAHNKGDLWDSGKIISHESINIEYAGTPLSSHAGYFWKVRIWDKQNRPGSYSKPQYFKTGVLSGKYTTARYPLEKREVAPVKMVEKNRGHYFIDFGKAAFGTIKVTFSRGSTGQKVLFLLGEAKKQDNTVDEHPGGSVRFRKIVLPFEKGPGTYVLPIPPDARNTGKNAIKMPAAVGEVMPFRYCEVIDSPCDLDQSSVRQVAVNYPFDDAASRFRSSNRVLNDVWQLCKYSIKATSFCGVYVDGDRERIPYEADAYINQLSHYNVDREYSMARYSHEYLITHPTWPTEWIMHSVFMAWADYLYTGNKESIAHYYNDLKAKTLIALAREDGLISTTTGLDTDEFLQSIHFHGRLKDIVDWPPASFSRGEKGERDGYVFTDINTVVNAFHYRTLVLMHKIARALNKAEDAAFFLNRAKLVRQSVNEKLFDHKRTIYVDGEGTDHASLHANMFPLAFGMVPEKQQKSVVAFIKSRGMACSVYGAQYLLEALYRANEDEYALELMTADSDRSWPHMIYDVGTTITLEAWDRKYKRNLDWNHAWGTAPANIIPRYVMGIRPLVPGFGKFLVKPQPGSLKSGSLDLSTIRGTVHVDFRTDRETFFTLHLTVPANTMAKVLLPGGSKTSALVKMDGVRRAGEWEHGFIMFDDVGPGTHSFTGKLER